MAVTSLPSTHTGDRNAPVRLRIEHMPEEPGLDLIRPRLSWWLPPGASKQLAYRLRTKQWDSGRVQSDNNLLVELGGPALRARQRWNAPSKSGRSSGRGGWSDPIQWEMGLLDPDDWKARWIEPPESGDLRPGKRPTWYLRHEFVVGKPPRGATLCNHSGVYEICLNKVRVGDLRRLPLYELRTFFTDLRMTRCGPAPLDRRHSVGRLVPRSGRRFPRPQSKPLAFLAQMELYGMMARSGHSYRAGVDCCGRRHSGS